MTPMFNGRRPFIFFIESLKERDTSRFNIKVFEDHMQAHYLIRAMSKYLEKNGQICTPTIEDVHDS